jgi:hypothetical protein
LKLQKWLGIINALEKGHRLFNGGCFPAFEANALPLQILAGNLLS